MMVCSSRAIAILFSFGYKRSLALVESDVQELKQKLLSTGVVSLGQVGKLTQDRVGGGIRFLPNEEDPFSIQYYGLRLYLDTPTLIRVPASVSKPPRRQEISTSSSHQS